MQGLNHICVLNYKVHYSDKNSKQKIKKATADLYLP